MSNYTVKCNDKVGRYAIASRVLNAGEVILDEEPVAIGPKLGAVPTCLGCLNPLTSLDFQCPNCKWPMCGQSCSEAKWHQGECPILARTPFTCTTLEPSSQYDCIVPLRLLLSKEEDDSRWRDEVEPMISHCEKRKEDNANWQMEQVNIVQYLREQCKLEDRFTEEEVHRACGLLEVNAFEALTNRGFPLRGLYPLTAILSHCCVSNTCHTVVPYENFRMVLRASVDIADGEELFSSYTGSLQCTITRREILATSKYFSCDCRRCADPKELGTNLGTLKCTKCDNGVINSVDPLDDEAPWMCNGCDFGLNGRGVKRVIAAIQEDIDQLEAMDMGPEKLQQTETILRKYRSVLHPKHSLNVSLWYLLIQMYGRVDQYTINDLPNILLERKVNLCTDFLSVLDVVEPGLTRIRGLTLYELHVAVLTLAKSKYSDNILSKDELKEQLEKVIEMLKECSEILSLEPSGCPESKLATISNKSIKQLTKSIASLSK